MCNGGTFLVGCGLNSSGTCAICPPEHILLDASTVRSAHPAVAGLMVFVGMSVQVALS